MNILTLDTALNKSYIGLLYEEKEFYKTISSDDKNYHSAYLARVLDDLFKDKELNNIDYLGINTGVGSFTGIRVGLSFAKIITNRLNIKAIPLTTSEILNKAYDIKDIMLDARRGSVFYTDSGCDMKLISYEEGLSVLEKKEKVISDNSLKTRFKSDKLFSFEEDNIDLSKFELELAKEKIKEGKYITSNELKPNYIQTPPIYSKN